MRRSREGRLPARWAGSGTGEGRRSQDLKRVREAWLEPNGQVTFLFQEGEGGTRH